MWAGRGGFIFERVGNRLVQSHIQLPATTAACKTHTKTYNYARLNIPQRIYLDTLVTLVDSSTFIQDYASRWAQRALFVI